MLRSTYDYQKKVLCRSKATELLSINISVYAIRQTYFFSGLYEGGRFPKRKRSNMGGLFQRKKIIDFIRRSYAFLHHLDYLSIYALVLDEIEIFAPFYGLYLEVHDIY
jgi:hypothetical protein